MSNMSCIVREREKKMREETGGEKNGGVKREDEEQQNLKSYMAYISLFERHTYSMMSGFLTSRNLISVALQAFPQPPPPPHAHTHPR